MSRGVEERKSFIVQLAQPLRHNGLGLNCTNGLTLKTIEQQWKILPMHGAIMGYPSFSLEQLEDEPGSVTKTGPTAQVSKG